AYLEIWWPPGVPPEQVFLTVVAPDGTTLHAGRGFVQAPPAHWSITLIEARKNGAMALVAVAPTAGSENSDARGPHGVWKISITAVPGGKGDIHLYVARADHDMGARRRARSRYLSDAAYDAARSRPPAKRDEEAPDSVIRRKGTLNGVATG